MSEVTDKTIDELEPPTISELNERMAELDESGIVADAWCEKCDSRTETRILPGEYTRGTLCVDCLLKLVNDIV